MKSLSVGLRQAAIPAWLDKVASVGDHERAGEKVSVSPLPEDQREDVPNVENAPIMTDEDERILDGIWDNLGKP